MPGQPVRVREPNAKIAELYGYAPNAFVDSEQGASIARYCPIRDTLCDVTANRHKVATLDLGHKGVATEEKNAILCTYGEPSMPLGICSCWTRRHNETVAKPWILCPKRLLSLEPPRPVIPQEVKNLIEISNGTRVGVWSELKFRRKEPATSRFFEYTFDYLLMALDSDGVPSGVPYIIEVMTSSTRGGGLTEHMVDVLLGRDQRNLGGVVDSVYTPNYRQVFERMLGQFIAKSEIAEAWGGRAIWVLQDVLLDYIEQTTAFDSRRLEGQQGGNVFVEVFRLEQPESSPPAPHMHLVHDKSLRGRARSARATGDYTSMLGLGYAPPVAELLLTLQRGCDKSRGCSTGRWFEFNWGAEVDPTDE